METNPTRRVTAVLLAAGLSSRMGDFKQLMPYRGGTIVESCVETILASPVDDVVVVVGHRADEVEAAVSRFPVRVLRNSDYALGMSTSAVAGVRAAEGADAVMICLADQPQIPAAVFEAVLAAYRASGARIVVPTIAGDTGHPVVFDLSLRDEILAVDPSAGGLRTVTYAHRGEVLRVPVDTVSVLDDIDTPDDYERLRE
jgi:molybdenum cofactor cytidylyltransferase